MKLKKKISKFKFFRQRFTKSFIENVHYPNHTIIKDKLGPVVTPQNNDVIASCFKKYGSWQGGISTLIKDLCNPASVVLEIGSNYGLHAREIAHHCAELHCVEANPSIIPYLQMNLIMCGAGNTSLYNICASEKRGEITFLDRSNTSNSGYSRVVKDGDDLSEGKQITLPAMPLDEEFKDFKFDILKIDIEGHELEALKGARKTLSNVQYIVIETDHLDELRTDLLKDFDFFKIQLLPEHLDKAYILHPADANFQSSEYLAVKKKGFSKE